MPTKRKFTEEQLALILEDFYSDIPAMEIGRIHGASYFPTIRRIWVKHFGEEALRARFRRLCAISKFGKRNPMYGKIKDQHPNWKEVTFDPSGYRMIDAPEWYTGTRHKHNKVLEHIIVACEAAGLTEPPPWRIVHHKNHRKSDNRPENLEFLTRGQHAQEHKFRAGKFKQRATTIPKGSRKSKKDSEAHSGHKADDIV